VQVRGSLIVAAVTALFVALAYQRPAAYRLRPGEPADDKVEGFGAAGTTLALRWNWIGPASRVVFADAGQIVRRGRLRMRLGLPPEAGPNPRRVQLTLGGARLADLDVGPGFSIHEIPLDARVADTGDWVLTLSVEGTDSTPTGSVALGWAELVSEPPLLPPWRTLLLAVLGAVALWSILQKRLGARGAIALAVTGGAVAALGLAFARPQSVALLAPVVAVGVFVALVVSGTAAVGRARAADVEGRPPGWFATPGGVWVGGLIGPLVALGALVHAAFTGLSVAGLVALLAIGVWFFRFLAVSPARVASESSIPHERLFIAAATLLAFGFRLYRLEDIPFAIFRDEARHGLLALRLLAEPDYRPLFLGPPINQPIPYFLAVAAAFDAFGPSLFSLRLVSALAGAAAVPLLWLLVRETVGPREGLLAALGLAVSSWHVSISRFAVNYVEPSLFSLPAYLLLWRGFRRGRAIEVAVAGLLVGLAQYAAHTAKPLLIVSFGLVVDEAISRIRSYDTPGLRRVLKGGLAAATLGVLVLVPLLRYVRESPRAYMARAQQVSLWNPTHAGTEPGAILLGRSVAKYAGAFHVSGDANGRHHLPRAPLLDPLSGLAFLAGLAVALTSLGSPVHRFLILWLLAGLLPGVLTVDAPSALRTVEAAPAVYAVVGVGATALWKARPGGPAWLWRTIVALAVAACVAWNGWIYFVRMYDSPTVWRRFAPVATHLGKRLRALRVEGALPKQTTLLVPRVFLEDRDNAFVLQFYWPEGLTLRALEDEAQSPATANALAVPNNRDLWAMVAAAEPRYARDAEEAATAQEVRSASLAPLTRAPAIIGPPFPATDRPTFWLYLLK